MEEIIEDVGFVDTEQFIQLVRENRILYDRNDERYKSFGERDVIWKEICVQLDIPSIKEGKRRWKNLRNGYALAKKRMKRSGNEAKWAFFDHLSFLDEFLLSKKVTDSDVSGAEDIADGDILIERMNSESKTTKKLIELPNGTITTLRKWKLENARENYDLCPQSKSIIMNVLRYVKKLNDPTFQVNFKQTQLVAAEMCGVSTRTIQRICHEERNPVVGEKRFRPPRRNKRICQPRKLKLESSLMKNEPASPEEIPSSINHDELVVVWPLESRGIC